MIKHYFLLSLFSLLLFVPGIATLPVTDRDEAHFAQASRQMLQTGHYFQIRFQEKTRFQKPPGINWLQAASVKLLSNANSSQIWPYRIPSLLSALACVLLVYFLTFKMIRFSEQDEGVTDTARVCNKAHNSFQIGHSSGMNSWRGANEQGEGVYTEYMTDTARVCNKANNSFQMGHSSGMDSWRGANEQGEGVYTEYMTDTARVCNKARNSFPKSVALLAAGLLATTLLFTVEAHLAVIDAALLASITLMQTALWLAYKQGLKREPLHWGWALCFWLAMAGGIVLKGVSLLVGCFTIIALSITERRIDWLRVLRPYYGILILSVVIGFGLYELNVAEHSNYLMQMLHKDLLPKLQGGHESHGRPPLFHLLILPVMFWPASLFLGPGVSYAVRNYSQPVVKFVLAWILPTWIFFEAMPTKLPQYVLPTFPAIAILCALALSEPPRFLSKLYRRWQHVLQLLWALLSLSVILSLTVVFYLLTHKFWLTSLLQVTILITLILGAVYFSWGGRYKYASMTICAIALCSYPLIFKLLPQLEPLWLSYNILHVLPKEQFSVQKKLLVVGFSEPSVVFNLNTNVVAFTNPVSAAQIISKDHARSALINRNILHLWQQEGLQLCIQAHQQGLNYSKGKWVELFLVKGC